MEYIYEQSHNTIGSPLTVVRLNSVEQPKLIYCNWHRELEFIYVSKGTLVLMAGDKKVTLHAGDIGVVNINEVHYGEHDPSEECEIFVFLISAEQILPADDRGASRFLQSLLKGEMLLAPALTPVMPHYTQVVTCFKKMYELYSLKQPGFELLSLSLIYELLYAFFSEQELLVKGDGLNETQTREKIERLNQVLGYIEQNYSRKIYIAELADLLYMGVDNFYKFFVSVTGVSPASYINSYRMKQSASLLASTELPVTDICYRVGFNNVSYFIKTFQKHYGCTPKKYRTLCHEKERVQFGGVKDERSH